MKKTVVLLAVSATLSFSFAAQGGWQADVGYDALMAELGVATPDGTGIDVAQIEAPESGGKYAPNPSDAQFTGKTITLQSGASDPSSHATTVGRYYYGNTSSITPGITQIDSWLAGNWIGSGFLRTNSTSAPAVESRDVQNHSWIGSLSSESDSIDALRRFDYAINRDNFVATVGLNNSSGTVVPDLLGHAYNAIAVGRTDGGHSRGGTSFDTAGRVKPDIVAPLGATSWTTPVVGSAAAMMLEVGGSQSSNATQSQTIKAVLMAGATKQEFSWARTHSRPLDDVFGVGELNVHRSYHVINAGEQESGTTPVGTRGWDFDNTATDATYYFSVPTGQTLEELSAVLTWNRVINDGVIGPLWGDPQASVADMQLELWSASGTTLLDRIDYSESSVDNVEHVHWGYLDGGDYALRVVGDGTATDYALAWYSPDAIPTPSSHSHRWVAEASAGDWAGPLNWLAAGNPDADWDAQVSNDYTTLTRTAMVSADSTVRTIDVAGPTGAMIVKVESAVTLTATDEVSVAAGGQIAVDGELATPTLQLSGGSLTGEGTVDGNVINDGQLAPGASVGALAITGNYDQAAGGRLVAEIDDAVGGPGVGHDHLAVTGQVTLDGTLELSVGSFVPAYGDTFELINASGGVSGIFAQIQGVLVNSDLALGVAYTANGVTATAALPGDANLDGDVDVFELNGSGDAQVLGSNSGMASGATWADGDFNGDGDVDIFQGNGEGDAQLLGANVGGASADLGDDAGTGTAELVYDVTTGEVWFDIGGVGEIAVVGLELQGAAAGSVITANANDLNGTNAGQNDGTVLAYFDFNGLPDGEDSVGLVLPTGLSQSDIGFSYTPLGGQSVQAPVTIVPEPTSIALLGLGGLALLRRRRA